MLGHGTGKQQPAREADSVGHGLRGPPDSVPHPLHGETIGDDQTVGVEQLQTPGDRSGFAGRDTVAGQQPTGDNEPLAVAPAANGPAYHPHLGLLGLPCLPEASA